MKLLKGWTLKASSILFFPIFIPMYVLAFLLFYDDYYFIGISATDKIKLLIIGLLNLVFFPLLTLFLLRNLKLIKKDENFNKKNRIITLFALALFYFWVFYIFKNTESIPRFMVRLQLCFFISISLSPMFQYFLNISLYSISIVTIVFALIFERINLQPNQYYSYPLFIWALLCSGLIISIRLYAGKHNNKEILYSIYLCFLACWIGNIAMKFV